MPSSTMPGSLPDMMPKNKPNILSLSLGSCFSKGSRFFKHPKCEVLVFQKSLSIDLMTDLFLTSLRVKCLDRLWESVGDGCRAHFRFSIFSIFMMLGPQFSLGALSF